MRSKLTSMLAPNGERFSRDGKVRYRPNYHHDRATSVDLSIAAIRARLNELGCKTRRRKLAQVQARERSAGTNALERRGLIRTQFQVILGGLSACGLDQRRHPGDQGDRGEF